MKFWSLILFTFIILGCDDGSNGSSGQCGDGVVDIGEECDGENLYGNTCATRGYYTGDLTCNVDCTFNETDCGDDGYCGDGVINVENGEQCDGDTLGGATCNDAADTHYYGGTLRCSDTCEFDYSDCAAAGYCGDGNIDTAFGEVCDGASLPSEETCASNGYYGSSPLVCGGDCQLDFSPCQGRCGDGVLDGAFGEACDGQAMGVETCETLNYHGGSIMCSAQCQYDLSPCEAYGQCGDGVLQPSYETCDGTDFGDATCRDLAKATGELQCDPDCMGISYDDCYGKLYIAAGSAEYTSCAIDELNDIYCWGQNSSGQFGNGTLNASLVPTQTDGGNYIALSSGSKAHFCAIQSGGVVFCWGLNADGQIGNGTTSPTPTTTPERISSDRFYSSIDTGYNHSCALTTTGTPYCWGKNSSGQLGDESVTSSATPVQVKNILYLSKIAAGGDHSCALTGSGQAYCWGLNGNGQLGNNSTTDRNIPTQVSGGLTFSEIYCGNKMSCGLTSAGVAYCWGQNFNGSLGIGSLDTVDMLVPTPVSGGRSFTSLSLNAYHVCGVEASTQELYCWGFNNHYQLGTGNSFSWYSPVQVDSAVTYLQAAVGGYHTCALSTNGGVYCWGANNYGQVGNGTTTTQTLPAITSEPN